MTEADLQRIDKWLWHVRLQPSRTRASQFVRDGFARLNGVRVTDPARGVRAGDVLTLALHHRAAVVRVLSLPPRRGSASDAARWYEPLAEA